MRPPVHCWFSEGSDASTWSKNLPCFRIGSDPIGSPVEVTGLAILREHIGIKEIDHWTLPQVWAGADKNISVRHNTVMRRPPRTSPKLNVCCVVRAAFSLRLRSFHCTRPSSLTIVTRFLDELGGLADDICEAYALIVPTAGLLGRVEFHDETPLHNMFLALGRALKVIVFYFQEPASWSIAAKCLDE